MEKSYGKEVIIDLFECDSSLFTRKHITQFFIELCYLIKMEREDLHFWDYEGDPEGYRKAADHLKGTSAIQFIRTSNITVHTLDVSKQVMINVFSCKDFSSDDVINFSLEWFKGKRRGRSSCHVLYRGER